MVIGDPLILLDSTDLESHGLFDGQEGLCNSIVNIEGIDYVYFMPSGSLKSFVISANRVKVDEEKLNEGLG